MPTKRRAKKKGQRGWSGPRPAEETPRAPFFERYRFVWMCVGYAGVAVSLSVLLLSDLVFDDLLAGLRETVASLAAASMSLLGFPITSRGFVINGPGSALMIVNECTGVDATILLVSAVVVFPASLLQKVQGVALAIFVMMVVNFIRVLTLIYLGSYSPDLLDAGHLYVWPIIVIIVGVGTLLVWADRVGPDPT